MFFLFISKLQRCSRWSSGMDQWFHLTLSCTYGYLVMSNMSYIIVSVFHYLYQEFPDDSTLVTDGTVVCHDDNPGTNSGEWICHGGSIRVSV